MLASQISTTPIALGMVAAVVAFLAYVPLMIRDSRRPLPPVERKPTVMRERRPVTLPTLPSLRSAGLRRPTPPAPAPSPLPSPTASPEPAVRRRIAVTAASLVAFSILSGMLFPGRGARTRRIARR